MISTSFKKEIFIYFAAPALSCSTWDLQSCFCHTGSLVEECELLVAACGTKPRPPALGVQS